MGVGPIAFTLYTDLAKRKLLKPGQFIFELGSQQVFDAGWRDSLMQFCAAMGKPKASHDKTWKSARDLMEAVGFHYTSADIDGRFGALMIDLNKPWRSPHGYDVVTNHGTTEHCFDQAECFRTIHYAARPNGLMIHCVPMQGYAHHGFYLYQPEMFAELARANRYEMISLHAACDVYKDPTLPIQFAGPNAKLPGHVMLCAVMRRTDDADFVPPIQRMYQQP